MKTVLTILFLCSVAVSQQASATQSSELPSGSMHWDSGSTLQDSEVTCKTDDRDSMHVTKCNFGKHSPEEVINWMIDKNRERDTCGSKGVQWILGKDGKILYGRRTPECPIKKKTKASAPLQSSITDNGLSAPKRSSEHGCIVGQETNRPQDVDEGHGAYLEVNDCSWHAGPNPRYKQKKAKAGAHSEATGKPDSEKPEKKLP